MPIIQGDVADEATLRRAGVERADVLLLLVPDEKAVLAAIPLTRKLNRSLKIVARCAYTSSGLEAHRIGARTRRSSRSKSLPARYNVYLKHTSSDPV